MRIKAAPTLLGLEEDIEHFGSAPFASPAFYRLFEQAGVVGPGTGWSPVYLLAIEKEKIAGFMAAYVKTNSYGEYIFDWAWADLYQRAGMYYYPKLVSATPFSPVNCPKTMGASPEAREVLLQAYNDLFQKSPELSSAHALFVDEEEARLLEQEGFFIRKTLQYHLELDTNSLKTFDDFLNGFKARKRKQVRKERRSLEQENLKIGIQSGPFEKDMVESVYQLYLGTIEKKLSFAYLNRKFFELLFQDWSEHIVLATAEDEKGLAAMALYLKTNDTLYGRYWGAREDVDIPYLHFELSYYQGIEYCLKHDIKLFEAGAQGEQKLLRGFRPVEILSAHKLRNTPLRHAIENHVKMESAYMQEQAKALSSHLPYKTK